MYGGMKDITAYNVFVSEKGGLRNVIKGEWANLSQQEKQRLKAKAAQLNTPQRREKISKIRSKFVDLERDPALVAQYGPAFDAFYSPGQRYKSPSIAKRAATTDKKILNRPVLDPFTPQAQK